MQFSVQNVPLHFIIFLTLSLCRIYFILYFVAPSVKRAKNYTCLKYIFNIVFKKNNDDRKRVARKEKKEKRGLPYVFWYGVDCI